MNNVNHKLTIIDQDYDEALNIASKENKMLFIDFYTTWCAPCKELDRLIFQNDSLQQVLGKDFVLLRYNAEADSVFHLSKKHHVGSYPTAIVLNNEGFVLNRKYGFPGEDFKELAEIVLEFTQESIDLNSKNEVLTGYTNTIEVRKYPQFYIEYVDRTNTKFDSLEFMGFWKKEQDIFSESYFSPLIYFGREVPDSIADVTLKHKEKYFKAFGKLNSEILFYFLTTAKFDRAIKDNSPRKFEEATAFAKSSLSKGWTDDILPNFEMDFLKAQNRWGEVYQIKEKLKNEGKLSNGAINHFCWMVYKDCNDKEVILRTIEWMKQVTASEPTFHYLDTYAHLLHKAGNKEETRRVAELAIEKAGDENTANLKGLLGRL